MRNKLKHLLRAIMLISMSFGIITVSCESYCLKECLCLSQTQVLCNTGGLTFIPTHKIPPSVRYLSFSKNDIAVIKTETFSQFRELRKLSLDGNLVSKVNKFAFRGLPNLKELSVQHTNLESLEKFSFSALQNVTSVRLGYNKISLIEEYAFAGSSNIESILLEHNPIHKIDSYAFSGLRHVGSLILPHGIKFIMPDAFNGLQSVGVLKLAYMDLQSLREFTFRGLSRVHLLTIQESDLGLIKARAFQGMFEIESFNLINNKIDYIDRIVVNAEDKIGIFRFVGNHVLDVPRQDSIRVRAMENFTVVGNHFPCDCRVHSLIGGPLANGTSADFAKKNHCISPIDSKGKTIFEAMKKSKCGSEHFRQNWVAAAVSTTVATDNKILFYASLIAVATHL